MLAFWIQFFHHIEHAILQTQAIIGHNLMGRPVPTSLVQLWVPRVELHLFYNTIVFIPMVIAMYYHLFPPAAEKSQATVRVRAARRGVDRRGVSHRRRRILAVLGVVPLAVSLCRLRTKASRRSTTGRHLDASPGSRPSSVPQP